MLSTCKIHSLCVKQDNCTQCFNSRSNNQNGKLHNRRAKRLASKRLRRLDKQLIIKGSNENSR